MLSHSQAIMFHHFHNENHPIVQGSLSENQFEDMLDWLIERYNLLNADEYLYKLNHHILQAKDICLTLDDALLCQSEIAAPILRKRNIQAFFFVYSSPFMGKPDYLEIYRYFRTTEFKSVDDFYEKFFHKTYSIYTNDYELATANYDAKSYLKAFPFYSENDKWFRYLRDITLGKERYEEVMGMLMIENNFHPNDVMKKLWMNDSNLNELHLGGHKIGLHSFSHPTTLHLLDRDVQLTEYKKNYKHLCELLNTNIFAMSHPCGNYNNHTLEILNSLGIVIGFRSNNAINQIKSNLEVPREDHANILRVMSK